MSTKELADEKIIEEFLNELCDKQAYHGEVFDITPSELLKKFIVYYKKRRRI